MAVCHRMCDYHHEHLEEEERLTTMVTSIGEKAQREGRHYDPMTRKTVMITATQDRLQERFGRKRTTTSSDYVIRLTDRLLRCGTKIISCFFTDEEQDLEFLEGQLGELRRELRRKPGRRHVVDLTGQGGPPETPGDRGEEERGVKRSRPEDREARESGERQEQRRREVVEVDTDLWVGSRKSLLRELREKLDRTNIPANHDRTNLGKGVVRSLLLGLYTKRGLGISRATYSQESGLLELLHRLAHTQDLRTPHTAPFRSTSTGTQDVRSMWIEIIQEIIGSIPGRTIVDQQ